MAFSLPVYVVLMVVGMATIAALAAKIWCADLAGMTARAAARGEVVANLTDRLDVPGASNTNPHASPITGATAAPTPANNGGTSRNGGANNKGGGRPDGREVIVWRDGDLVRVTVRMRVDTPLLGGLVVEEHAVALIEPTAETTSS